MRTYFTIIQFIQKFSLGISILLMLILPVVIVFFPNALSDTTTLMLYDISHLTVFFVMTIRPLADIFTKTKIIRPLVILRKGLGVLSASIVAAFIFSKIIIDPSYYFSSLITTEYWSIQNFALFAHLADISAIILLITSNNFSKRVLGVWWKLIQRLSYIYFYASSIYVFLAFKSTNILIAMIIVTLLTIMAYIINQKKLINQSSNLQQKI